MIYIDEKEKEYNWEKIEGMTILEWSKSYLLYKMIEASNTDS